MTSPPKMIVAISAAWPQNLRIEADTKHLHKAPVGDVTIRRRTLALRLEGFGSRPWAG
jgi:hypothetical protein